MQTTQCVVILDFGGQYTQLIARRVRENNVYSEVVPYTASLRQIEELKPVGIILSGGPASVLDQDAPSCDVGIFELGVPVLGICWHAADVGSFGWPSHKAGPAGIRPQPGHHG